MALTYEQTQELLHAHCYRVIDSMSSDDLFSYAMRVMAESFDMDAGQGNTDVSMLVQDILTAEGEDEDAAHQFIAGALNDELADELMGEEQISPWSELI